MHPKSLSVWTLGVTLLERQLVPELRGDIDNVYAQDRTCFAIQTVLRILALTDPAFAAACQAKGCSLGEAQAATGRASGTTTTAANTGPGSGSRSASRAKGGGGGIAPSLPLMPDTLRNLLIEKQLLGR